MTNLSNDLLRLKLRVKKILYPVKPKKFLGLITRCRDEFFVKEFCEYYLSQGVDKIYIVDDNSFDKSIYKGLHNSKVSLLYGKNIIRENLADAVYKSVKSRFEWIIYVDVDEFIATPLCSPGTIRDVLQSDYKNVDCVKVPWVMMSSGGRDFNPESILLENNFRWNHDKKHFNKVRKFRCRHSEIEIKSIFRPEKFEGISDHVPLSSQLQQLDVVDSIYGEQSDLSPFYQDLREKDIKKAKLVCYHYRIISKENNLNKLKTNAWYKQDQYTLKDLESSDYGEVLDLNMRTKVIMRKRKECIFVHIGKCGGSYLRSVFPDLNVIHMSKLTPGKISELYAFIILIRNPISRYVSAFNHSKTLANYDISGKSFDELVSNSACPYFQLPNKAKNAINSCNPFNEWSSGSDYLQDLSLFDSANALAESLTSDNAELRHAALRLFSNVEVEHIAKGIGWYLENGRLVEDFRSRIVYCADVKDVDLNFISSLTGLSPRGLSPYKRSNQNNKLTNELSETAIKNVLSVYDQTDYRALKSMVDCQLIRPGLFDEYRHYP